MPSLSEGIEVMKKVSILDRMPEVLFEREKKLQRLNILHLITAYSLTITNPSSRNCN